MKKKFLFLFESIISFSLLFLALLSFSIVILRYFFGIGFVWLQELLIYFHSFVFLFGSYKTLKLDKHVRVDVLYNKQSQSKKDLINRVGFLLLCLPCFITLIYVSTPYVLDSWKWLEKSSDAGGLSYVYILKTFIPVFSVCFILQGFFTHFLNSKESS